MGIYPPPFFFTESENVMDQNLKDCQKTIGYIFRDDKLLDTALTHSSLTPVEKNYERLEFMGDAILGMVIACKIYTA